MSLLQVKFPFQILYACINIYKDKYKYVYIYIHTHIYFFHKWDCILNNNFILKTFQKWMYSLPAQRYSLYCFCLDGDTTFHFVIFLNMSTNSLINSSHQKKMKCHSPHHEYKLVLVNCFPCIECGRSLSCFPL